MFQSLTNLIAAVVLFGCVIVGAALLMSGGKDDEVSAATDIVPPVQKRQNVAGQALEEETGTEEAAAEEGNAIRRGVDAARRTIGEGAQKLTREIARAAVEKVAGSPSEDASQTGAAAEPKTAEQSAESAASPGTEPQAPAQPQTRTYEVKKGDTLYSISRRLLKDGSRWRDIAEANDLSDETRLLPGKKLIIPAQ